MTATSPRRPVPMMLLLGALAFAGSAAYALSFLPVQRNSPLALDAALVGGSAAVSWILFGLVILIVMRGNPSVRRWAWICLVTMSVGIGVKMLGVAGNLLLWAMRRDDGAPLVRAHLALLLLADVAMACTFVPLAVREGMTTTRAIAMWVLVLNGFMAACLATLWNLKAVTL